MPDGSGHWSPHEIASFVCHPGAGRVLSVGPSSVDVTGFEHVLKDAGYRIGRLPVTRDASHLPHAAATFMPHVIYLALAQPMATCLNALELLGADPRTKDVPLVALIDDDIPAKQIEDAYTRSGCDFLHTDATAVEYLARTHLLTRLAAALKEGAAHPEAGGTRLHEPPRPGAANDDPRAPLSLLDSESGAHSARYFAQRLPAEIARATRYGRDLTVMLVECPDAATSAGVAARVTVHLREECRETDLIARADATRFVVLLPETPMSGAETLAERMSAAMIEEKHPAHCSVLPADAPTLARILAGPASSAP